MADDPYNWLDKDAAERMLRGDPVGSRDGVGARELEQLLAAAKAVGAGAPGTAELPGEEAALAAFRRAHHGTGPRVSAVSGTRSGGFAERTCLGRPFRRGFAVALTVCAIGGVAVAAGTGMLPPFEGDGPEPEPGSSVSAAETPGILESKQPSGGTASPSPHQTPGEHSPGPSGTTSPGGGPSGSQRPGGGGGRDNTAGGSGDDGKTRPGDVDSKKLLLSLCRDYQSGKGDSMDSDKLGRLAREAGSRDKVGDFCRTYLASHQDDGRSGDNNGNGGDDGHSGGSGGSGGSDHGNANGGGKGNGGGSGNGGGNGKGGREGGDNAARALSTNTSTGAFATVTSTGAFATASAPSVTPSDTVSPTASPSPTGQV
ncbi:hypothetical protein [Streptomyces halobius]|uniref:Uncharacterized protein n=1 Tax=Streptomyces halobius TaxID=2879846 RepID=A0ABY4M6R9_9ACTN|nr:hypothetical protein [Streptomyces halobius]UQA93456.1 hypothetical protein K9S39_17795 [Streptomyces halobius]